MITTNNVTVQFGPKPLFENVSVKFNDGRRYGLIGANGCGKSTFLKVMSGELEPAAGNVNFPSNARVAVLKQDQFAFEPFTVIDTVIMGHAELWRIKSERDQLYAQPEMSAEDGMRAAELEMEFAELDGYSAEAKAGELLLGIGIEAALHQGPMSAVAPGWKLRVLLAQALFADPDILLLDEPTNNLDINTIRWLEGVLNQRQSTMVLISHDRHFLNSVCTDMADLDYANITLFPGNYDDFMIAATAVRERMEANNSKKKARIAELQTFVSRFSANASKARQATSRARQLEKIKLEEMKPSSRVSPYIRFEQSRPLHRLALQCEGISKAYDADPLFRGFNISIEAGARVAIIGPNGAGKTTLLCCLAGDLTVDKGMIKHAENAALGFVPQDHSAEFESTTTLFDWMSQWRGEGDDEQVVRAALGRMLFSRDDIHKPVNVLSGGERARMLFAKLTLQKPNVLFLDEPTNHLDMESIEALNLALTHYPGTLVFVSHDREFVSSLATRILDFTPSGLIDFTGSYDDYLLSQGIEDRPIASTGT